MRCEQKAVVDVEAFGVGFAHGPWVGVAGSHELPGDGLLEYAGDLRERYTIGLGTWEAMIVDVLGQIATDAGSLARGFEMLRMPPSLLDAWRRAVSTGMASLQPDALARVALAPSVRALRGDRYLDLAKAVGSLAVAGDGALDPAPLRRCYTIDRAAWLRMVDDLLDQVVGDAASIECASTVLALPIDSLIAWVRWFVSRASIDAACSRWPGADRRRTRDRGLWRSR